MLDRGPRLYEELEGFREWELEQHRLLFEAIRDGDAELAAQRMHEHVAAMEGHYKKAGEA
jgi:DNA-binding FadR family transcriptional regulator